MASETAKAVHGVRAGAKWKEDEVVALLTYYRKKVDDGTFKKMVKRNQLFADHINQQFHFKDPQNYSFKTADNVSDKIRHSRNLYDNYKKKFHASLRVMTETGRETDELDAQQCQQAWSGWALYDSIFGDDPNVDNPNIVEAGLPNATTSPSTGPVNGTAGVPPVLPEGSREPTQRQQTPPTGGSGLGSGDDTAADDASADDARDDEDFHEFGVEEPPVEVEPEGVDNSGDDSDTNVSKSHSSKKQKTSAGGDGKTKQEVTPRTISRDSRVLQKVADQFEAMAAVKEKIAKENRDAHNLSLQMQLKHEREMFELKSNRDDARLASLLDKKYAHEKEIFGGLVEVIKLALTSQNAGASRSSAPSDH